MMKSPKPQPLPPPPPPPPSIDEAAMRDEAAKKFGRRRGHGATIMPGSGSGVSVAVRQLLGGP